MCARYVGTVWRQLQGARRHGAEPLDDAIPRAVRGLHRPERRRSPRPGRRAQPAGEHYSLAVSALCSPRLGGGKIHRRSGSNTSRGKFKLDLDKDMGKHSILWRDGAIAPAHHQSVDQRSRRASQCLFSSRCPSTRPSAARTIEALQPAGAEGRSLLIITLNDATLVTNFLVPSGVWPMPTSPMSRWITERRPSATTCSGALGEAPELSRVDLVDRRTFDHAGRRSTDYVVDAALEPRDGSALLHRIVARRRKGAKMLSFALALSPSQPPVCSTHRRPGTS